MRTNSTPRRSDNQITQLPPGPFDAALCYDRPDLRPPTVGRAGIYGAAGRPERALDRDEDYEAWLALNPFEADSDQESGTQAPKPWLAIPKPPRKQRPATRKHSTSARAPSAVVATVKSISQLAREAGVSRATMLWRLEKWPLEKALSTPRGRCGPKRAKRGV